MFEHLSTLELLCIVAALVILFFVGKSWLAPRKSSPLELSGAQGTSGTTTGSAPEAETTKDLGGMLITTTSYVEGYHATRHMGVVTGHCIVGANVFRDVFAGITDFVGGRSRSYEKAMRNAENDAARGLIKHAEELGANAILGVSIDYETIVLKGNMMMVNMVGTAVTLEHSEPAVGIADHDQRSVDRSTHMEGSGLPTS